MMLSGHRSCSDRLDPPYVLHVSDVSSVFGSAVPSVVWGSKLRPVRGGFVKALIIFTRYVRSSVRQVRGSRTSRAADC